MNDKNPKVLIKKERRLKKTFILAALAMLLSGLLLAGGGLLAGRSHPEALAEAGGHRWYRTFAISEDSFWIGLDFGGFQFISFGI